MERIVVEVDGSEAGRDALQWAVDEARRRNATVEAVHAWRACNAGSSGTSATARTPTHRSPST